MQQIDSILLKVASRCNMACDYCYVYFAGDSGWSRMPKLMSRETVESCATALATLFDEQQRPFSIILHGGEPLLLGHDRLTFLLHRLRSSLPQACSLSIQTNGTLLTKPILDLCAATNADISVSIDGPRAFHDRHRVGLSGTPTFDRTLRGIRLLQEHPAAHPLFTGVLSVIDPQLDPAAFYTFFKDLRVPSLSLLYRDANHSKLPPGKARFESTEYGEWLAALWDIYNSDPDPIPIRTLDDIVKLLIGGHASREGSGTSDYGILVIDTDGGISKNDTLKNSFDGADLFDTHWSVHDAPLFRIAQSAAFAKYVGLQRPTNTTCRDCPLLSICGGGMPLYRWSKERHYDNPSIYCHDHRHVIQHIKRSVVEAFE